MLKEIVEYIGQKTGFIIGNNLFTGFIPPTITGDCVVIIETGGKPVYDLPDYLEKTIQALSRAKDYHQAMSNALKIYNLLHGSAGITLPKISSKEYYINTIEAISAPQSLGQDEKGFFNISTNYVLRIQDK